jgi:hypothetical protein
LAALLALAGCAGSASSPDQSSQDLTIIPIDAPGAVDAKEIPVVPFSLADYEVALAVPLETIHTPMTEVPVTVDSVPKQPLIDRTQQTVYSVVNNSSQWFDNFFGSTNIDQEGNVRQGKVTLGANWDERDGLKGRARFKARFPLPAFRQRTRLVFGRGDADDFVDGTANNNTDSLPSQFNDFEDDDWLLGVGYSKDGSLSRGFDLGVGVKLASPVEPYVRVTYRWNKTFAESWLWQLRPRVFSQSQRGNGGSLNSILDYAVSSSWLLRSWIVLSAEDEIEGMGWSNNLIAYQSLTNRTAFSYSVFASGETEDEVELQNYGFEIRYRKQIAREYLFMELSTSLTWPRYFLIEKRESNIGIGIQFEMQFGDWPGRKQEN